MSNTQTLVEELNVVSKLKLLNPHKNLPDYVLKNLNRKFAIRAYQKEAIARFIYYLSDYPDKQIPYHLLFNMATGSGKTLLMAANILYLYELGYRNFIFFVNSVNIIEKTKANFLDKSSSKYLFADQIIFNHNQIYIKETDNFEGVNQDNINILFTTIQGLHTKLNNPQENAITFEEFEDKKIVFLSDEAHHINALTKNKLGVEEKKNKTSWEKTINKAFKSHNKNIMLEYTATIDLSNEDINKKYKDKIIYQYNLKEFREDKFSKDVKIIRSDLKIEDRVLQAVILSQYKRKIAEKYKIPLKPVILIKSQKTINQSEKAQKNFNEIIANLKKSDIEKIEQSDDNGTIKKAFDFFKAKKITYQNLIIELKEDFSEEKCIGINSKDDSVQKQIQVNTLEEENNQTRVIFTVNMLNEGWDVLNLYDIVRLYETRDARNKKAGKITMAEAQLIGRGARYYPFKTEQDQDIFKRKYDNQINNELRILEQLHYHSLNDSRYISELTDELEKTGIIPEKETRNIVTVSIKDKIKKTDFWQNGSIFYNRQKTDNRKHIKSISGITKETIFKYKLRTNKTTEESAFKNGKKENKQEETKIKSVKLNKIEKHINRKALDKINFYQFYNLKQFFPNLNSIDQFLTSDNYLGEIDIEIDGLKKQLNNLANQDKYEIAINIFEQLSKKIEASATRYIGTKKFQEHSVCNTVDETKTSEILIGGEDKEFGKAMSETQNDNLRLCLKNLDWYMYNENYGTSEEKHLIKFISQAIDNLKEKYNNIYLLRNEKIKIYKFKDGKALKPDFILFLTDKNTNKPLSCQIFIEPKGSHLLKTDKWKEDFLKQIQNECEISPYLLQTKEYKLIGLPLYNEQKTKKNFKKIFNKSLKIKSE
ncbi:MAG: DEAD/DEAH box helicase family protein [Deltaproteobacteria bacterium]|nr:DEAD/DEAH box helicase family protein [Deltaproteobacteria bacterium]